MDGIFNETERRLRELNGVLDLAVLIAVDVICEHDSHGLSKHEWQRRIIADAARKLTDVGQFSGRFALFSDEEVREAFDSVRYARIDRTLDPSGDLERELEFELASRGILHETPSESSSTVVPEDAEGTGQRS